MKNEHKIIKINREAFVRWRFNNKEDFEALGEDIKKDLTEATEYILDMNCVWDSTRYCPKVFMLNPEDVPDEYKHDWDKEDDAFEIYPDQVPYDEIEFVLVKHNHK